MTATDARRPLWTQAEIAAATGGRGRGEWSVSGVSIDTRTLEPGDLFVAIKGARDGHAFAAQALANGAGGVLVHRHPEGVAADAPVIVVDDTTAALAKLGVAGRARASAHVIAVTGSVGKTSTKEALKVALGVQASTHVSAASYNNAWGVPLSLARMPVDAAYGVFELGMNHAGELGPLSRMVRPHVAIVTTIEAAHLANFRNLGEIALAKAEVFEGFEAGATAILNRDNPYFRVLADSALRHGAARVLGFGSEPGSFARLVSVSASAAASCVSADIGGQAITYKVGAPGRHWVMNSLAVLAAVRVLGADLGPAGLALADLKPLRGRGQRHVVRFGAGTIEVIDESYNANPASMRAAIATLAASEPKARGRRIAVLGDMLEMGPEAPRFHAQLAQPLIEAGIDLCFTVGPNMGHLHKALPAATRAPHFAKAGDATVPVIEAIKPGDVVMIKGSNGSRMTQIVAALLDLDSNGALVKAG